MKACDLLSSIACVALTACNGGNDVAHLDIQSFGANNEHSVLEADIVNVNSGYGGTSLGLLISSSDSKRSFNVMICDDLAEGRTYLADGYGHPYCDREPRPAVAATYMEVTSPRGARTWAATGGAVTVIEANEQRIELQIDLQRLDPRAYFTENEATGSVGIAGSVIAEEHN